MLGGQGAGEPDDTGFAHACQQFQDIKGTLRRRNLSCHARSSVPSAVSVTSVPDPFAGGRRDIRQRAPDGFPPAVWSRLLPVAERALVREIDDDEGRRLLRRVRLLLSEALRRPAAEATALRYFTLDRTHHHTHHAQAGMIRRYLGWRNRHAADKNLRTVVGRARWLAHRAAPPATRPTATHRNRHTQHDHRTR